jgi:pyrroline-5-carboxylate reductase
MKVGFIGAGNMALALAQGLVRSGQAKAVDIAAFARTERSREKFLGAFSTPRPHWAASATEVCGLADLIVVAVKPQVFSEVLPPLREACGGKLILSVAAGRTISQLEEWLGVEARIVRAMPNTPSLVGYGASAYAGGHTVTTTDYALIHQVLGAVGVAVQVEECHLDAVTALSGSGPAYFFEMMEALIEAGVEQGLSVGLARTLVVQTCLGAAKMVEQTGDAPGLLAERVKSPKGTTEAGCAVLQEGRMRELLMAAVAAARARAGELSQGK